MKIYFQFFISLLRFILFPKRHPPDPAFVLKAESTSLRFQHNLFLSVISKMSQFSCSIVPFGANPKPLFVH